MHNYVYLKTVKYAQIGFFTKRYYMSMNDLHAKIVAAKNFLNAEIVRLRTDNSTVSPMGYRELGDRLDMIHEIERIGIRNLGERDLRRITRLITQLAMYQGAAN